MDLTPALFNDKNKIVNVYVLLLFDVWDLPREFISNQRRGVNLA